MTNITEIWLNEFMVKGRCALCANTGEIKKLDRKFFCFCPNGRAIKEHIEHPAPATEAEPVLKIDIPGCHIQTVRDGQGDNHKDDATLSRVIHDGKIYYYELMGWVTKFQFQIFVADVWNIDGEMPGVDVNDDGAFTISLD